MLDLIVEFGSLLLLHSIQPGLVVELPCLDLFKLLLSILYNLSSEHLGLLVPLKMLLEYLGWCGVSLCFNVIEG